MPNIVNKVTKRKPLRKSLIQDNKSQNINTTI